MPFVKLIRTMKTIQLDLILVSSELFSLYQRSVVVKHADSQHRGCQYDSSLCHNKNAIGEEGNGKPPHKIHFPR